MDERSNLEFELPEYKEMYERPKMRFDPWEENGGSIVAIAGEDFAIIASDTRLSIGTKIHTREQKKLFRLSEHSVLGSCGCWCDVLAFTNLLDTKMKMYEHEHHKVMSTNAIAHLVSVALYQRRLMPYGIGTVLAGLDAEGKGVVYSFDPVGHTEKEPFRCGGTASALLQPLLDNQIGRLNIERLPATPLTPARAIAIIQDSFVSAAERDVFTGDGIIFYVITKKAVTMEEFPLRKD